MPDHEEARIVELRNVTASRGETPVFDNLTLDLSRGRSTVILGPNGAGKPQALDPSGTRSHRRSGAQNGVWIPYSLHDWVREVRLERCVERLQDALGSLDGNAVVPGLGRGG